MKRIRMVAGPLSSPSDRETAGDADAQKIEALNADPVVISIDALRHKNRATEPQEQEAVDPALNALQVTVPHDWDLMGVYMIAAAVLVGAMSHSVPSGLIIGCILGGAFITALGARIGKIERAKKAEIAKFGFVKWPTILLPMLLWGFAIAYWSLNGELDWRFGIAAIGASTVLSAALLRKHLPQQLAIHIAVWSPLASLEFSSEALCAFAGFTILVILVGRFHYKLTIADTKREEALDRLRGRAEDILRGYEETGQGWFWETDRRGQLTYLSESAANALGRSRVDLLRTPFLGLFNLSDVNREDKALMDFHFSSRTPFNEVGIKANIAHGEERWWSVSGRPSWDSFGNFLGFRGSGTDLTEKKRSEESVARLAQYDSLTGLANRLNMQQALKEILAAPIVSQRECCVFLLDLDRFKQVNDTLGHPAGDALLKQVAKRLQNTVGEAGRVGRLGGDEFEVIVPGRWERERLGQLAEEIITTLSQPYAIDGQKVSIGASVGMAVAPADGETSEDIIRNADLALYAAKDGGRGRSHFYSNDLHSAAEERAKLEHDLRDAITKGNLNLFYQPVVEANSNTITGFEALVRWHHREHGWLSPAKFIPIAEDTGLISAIGEWAIRTACADLATWPGDIRCSVNVSPIQFANPQLPTIITQSVASAQIDPSRLELEITEGVFLSDNEGTDAMFAALKRVGVRLALDDFGTGYSSLGYLKKAPFDKIKIDQSFVRGATEPGNRNAAIITSITGLAESLGMETTAEGVETLDELELVRCLGCSHVQGYIYAKAMPAADVQALLRRGLILNASGPKSARSVRHSVMRRVVLEHEGDYYDGLIRNLSSGGALVEGLWNVPEGTVLNLAISSQFVIKAEAVWSAGDKMGLRFDEPIEIDRSGQIRQAPKPKKPILLQARATQRRSNSHAI